jgi:mannose-6-phosphate isomerase-like protein (cupin superfamily)
MTNRRDAVTSMFLALAASAQASERGTSPAWTDRMYTPENSKVAKESFGEVITYLEGKTGQLKSMTAGILVLNPGQEPHPPHHHPEEEFLVVAEGEGEIIVNGETQKAGPGFLMYSESNHVHGIKNTGSVPMRSYFFKWLA